MTISQEKIIIVPNKLKWADVMPKYTFILMSNTDSTKQKNMVRAELRRLAKEVDKMNGKKIVK